MSKDRFIKYIFRFFALLFIAAALHHLYEYFVPELRPEYPPFRHIIVFLINLVLAASMLRRTVFFLPILLFISIQQLYGHGGNLLASLFGNKALIYTDWLVVIFVPIIFFCYCYDIYNNAKER